MDLIKNIRKNSQEYLNDDTNNPLMKKLTYKKINFTQDENNTEKIHRQKNSFLKSDLNETFSKDKIKTKLIKLIVLDEKNNILTKKYELLLNLNKNIEKLPFNLDHYKINFVSINDLSKQLLNKLKTNDPSDINHYENLLYTSSVSFYNENLRKRLTEEDILHENNDIMVCKLEIFKNKTSNINNCNKYSDNNLNISRYKKDFDIEKLSFSPLNNKVSISKTNSEKILNNLSNKNKGSPSKINRDRYNADISLNDYINEEKNFFLEKLKNHEKNVINKKHKFSEDSFKEDSYFKKGNKLDHQNSRNKENLINKSESDSYILTNRSFYNKIKPKNVEILIRDSEKKIKKIDNRNIYYKSGSPGKTLDLQFISSENTSNINRKLHHSIFSLEKSKNDSSNIANKILIKTTDGKDKSFMKSDYNISMKNANPKLNSTNNNPKENNKEKNTFNNFKTKSVFSNLNSETFDNIIESKNPKLPIILNKSWKFDDNKSEKNEKLFENPKFVNYFDNKKEAQNIVRIKIFKKKFEKTQTNFDTNVFSKNLDQILNDNNFLPDINKNINKSVIFNSLYKSFQDNDLKAKEKKKKNNNNSKIY